MSRRGCIWRRSHSGPSTVKSTSLLTHDGEKYPPAQQQNHEFEPFCSFLPTDGHRLDV